MKKLAESESGIAMPLAMIMVMLIGVMGAGLLVFVTTDLNTVVEVNRGQKALEMAEVGIKAAKIQLQEKPDLKNYDNVGDPWNAGKNIMMDGETARVTIKPLSGDPAQPSYRVLSESQIGSSKRKVQAIFKAAGWGVKAYYTPGSIYIGADNTSGESINGKLFDRIDIRGVSLFSGRDVIIENNYSVLYRRFNTNTYGLDSAVGGGYRGDVSGSNRYCIYEDTYRTSYDQNRNNCSELFGGNVEYTDDDGLSDGSTARQDPLRYPSAWETANLPQPHIRIVANAECPELKSQWDFKPFAVDPNYHADALDDWNKPPFNSNGRAADPTNASLAASCQHTRDYGQGADPGLETYPTGAETYIPAGIAAEGRICRAEEPDSTPNEINFAASNNNIVYETNIPGGGPDGYGCKNTAPSIANLKVGDIRGGAGRIGYDGTTLTSGIGFYDKKDRLGAGATAETDSSTSGFASDISYPFDPHLAPNVPEILQIAQDQGRYVKLNSAQPTSTQWNQLFPTSDRADSSVAFLDADGQSVELPEDGAAVRKGIFVVRCGNLTNMDNFQGIILVLTDTHPDSPDATTCSKKGNYRTGKPGMPANDVIDIDGYLYAEGYGDPSSADANPIDGIPDYAVGIYISDGSNVDRLPRGGDFPGLLEIVGGGLQGVKLESWRECYNSASDTC